MTTIAATTPRGRPAGRVARINMRPHNVLGVWLRHFTAFKHGCVIEISAILVEPVLILLSIGFGVGMLVGEVGDVSYAVFVAPGIVVGNAMWHALFECSWGAFRRMQLHRIYDSILTAPVSIRELAAGEIAWGATRALMTTAAVLAAAAAFGLIDSPWGAAIVLIGVLTGLTFGGMGLFFASIAPTTHSLTLVFTLVGTPLFFFGGVFFPIESLPGYLQPLAWALPLTPAVQAARSLSTGEVGLTTLYAVLYLLALACTFYPLAVWRLRRRLIV
jgi:lipooligosaccharide transport system permease protein